MQCAWSNRIRILPAPWSGKPKQTQKKSRKQKQKKQRIFRWKCPVKSFLRFDWGWKWFEVICLCTLNYAQLMWRPYGYTVQAFKDDTVDFVFRSPKETHRAPIEIPTNVLWPYLTPQTTKNSQQSSPTGDFFFNNGMHTTFPWANIPILGNCFFMTDLKKNDFLTQILYK